MEKVDISCHLLIDPSALDFDHDFLAASQYRPVHLRDGGRPLGRFLYGCKHPFPGSSVGFLDHGDHFLKGHGRDFCPQPHELVAVPLRQDIRVHGHDLPQLNEGRAQVLQDGPEFFRRHSAGDVMPAEHCRDLPEP